jgi:hypothetical protein
MTRVQRAVAALAALLVVAIVGAGPAAAEQRTAAGGQTSVVFSYTSTDENGFPHAKDLRLTITRAGQQVYDQPLVTADCPPETCVPFSMIDAPDAGLTVTDLDGDGEPEVLVDLYTGGAHCCETTRILRWDGVSTYTPVDRNWGDPGYHLEDVDGDGMPEFVTADDRFAYAFASYADSAMPIRVLTLRAGRWANVTPKLPKLVSADARHWRTVYLKRRRGTRALGALAAWAADEYRLGHQATVRRFLSGELRAGRLRTLPGWPGKRTFIRTLERRLRAWGYAG